MFVQLYHQYFDVLRQFPDASTVRVVKKRQLNDFVTGEVVKMSLISTKSDYESRNWPCPCCNPAIDVVNRKKKDDEVINMLENVVLAETASPTSCCYRGLLANLIFTKEACFDFELSNTSTATNYCCPCILGSLILCCIDFSAGLGLCCGIFGCLSCCFFYENPDYICGRKQIESIEEAKSMMRTVRMMEREVPAACVMCPLCFPLRADKELVLQATRFYLLAKIERIMHNMLEDHVLTPEDLADFILVSQYGNDSEKISKEKPSLVQELSKFKANENINPTSAITMHNDEFKLLNIQRRLYKDKVSVILAREMLKLSDKKVFAKSPFRDTFIKSNLRGNTADILLNNYLLLGGSNHLLTPSRLAFLDLLILEKFNLVSHSSRIKEVGSYEEHKDHDEMFDLFGMKYVVTADSVFDCLAKAYSVAEKVVKMEDVYGIAVQFKQKKTSFLDFKIIVVLRGEQLSICEVQIIYADIFTTDSIVGGHDIHKKGGSSASEMHDIEIHNPITVQPK